MIDLAPRRPAPSGACPHGDDAGRGAPFGMDGAGMWLVAAALDRSRAIEIPAVDGGPTAISAPSAVVRRPGHDADDARGQPARDLASPMDVRTSARTPPDRLVYETYIRSAAWRRSPVRLAELRASGGRCRLCARGAPETSVEVHHNSYRRLGRERPSDVCTLCRECHRVVTAELRGRRYADSGLPELRDTPRTLAWRDAEAEDV